MMNIFFNESDIETFFFSRRKSFLFFIFRDRLSRLFSQTILWIRWYDISRIKTREILNECVIWMTISSDKFACRQRFQFQKIRCICRTVSFLIAFVLDFWSTTWFCFLHCMFSRVFFCWFILFAFHYCVSSFSVVFFVYRTDFEIFVSSSKCLVEQNRIWNWNLKCIRTKF